MVGPEALAYDRASALLSAAQARIRARRVLGGLRVGLAVGLGVAWALAALSRLWWPLPFGAAWLFPLPVLAASAIGAAVGLLTRGLDRREAAMLLDRALGTNELFVTALHLEKRHEAPGRDAVVAELAARTAAEIPLRDVVPVRWPGSRHSAAPR